MKTKKILIIISDNLFVRNYIKTKVFESIVDKKNFKVEFLVNNSIKLDYNHFRKYHYTRFQYPENSKNFFLKLFQRKIWQNTNQSNSFKFKLKIFLQFNRYIESYNEKFLHKIYKFPIRVLSLARNYLIYFVDTAKIFKFLRKKQENNLKINPALLLKIKKFKPDLVILPTNTINPTKYDLFRISKKIKFRILYLVDNWDNLSSKSTLFVKDSIFTVWGEQTLNHAVKIQGIKKNKIKLLGTPRFENYFKYREKYLRSYFKYKYILFTESTLPSESNILPELDKIISKNPKFKNLKVIYRPHPWRKSLKTYNQNEFRNIVIDPQVKKNYSLKNFSSTFQPSLDYYSSLLKNAEFIISGPTSMIIESLIFRKPVLLLNFKIKNFLLSPYNILKNFEHFKNIDRCSLIIKNNYRNDLEKNLVRCLKLRNNFNKKKIDQERNYFLTEKCKDYKSNLYKIIKELLN